MPTPQILQYEMTLEQAQYLVEVLARAQIVGKLAQMHVSVQALISHPSNMDQLQVPQPVEKKEVPAEK
jgi:hypothetical protein